MKHRLTAAGVTLGLAFSAGLAVPAAHASRPVERAAAPVVAARVTDSGIHLSDSTLRAGKITFKVVDAKSKGAAIFQILRLHKGYTLQDLGTDIGPAFGGDLAAIGRLDDNVTWLSGAGATPTKNGWFNIRLGHGRYIVLDQNSGPAPILGQLTVTGTTLARTAPKPHGSIITYTYGFDTVGRLPHDGWVRTTNKADQPHFIEATRVKQGTTHRQVARFIKSGASGNPPWVLRPSDGIGVISPGHSGLWKVDLPKGEYLLQCFWPDRMDGMPHFFHGMWQLVQLH